MYVECMCTGCICMIVRVWVHMFKCMLQWFRTRSCDPDPLREIQSCTSYGFDTQTIQKLTHGMIQRFIKVRVMENRRWFGSKTASFHVSICSCLFSYLPLSVGIYILLVSFHVTFCYILLVWLHGSLHETSMIVHLMYLVDMNTY